MKPLPIAFLLRSSAADRRADVRHVFRSVGAGRRLCGLGVCLEIFAPVAIATALPIVKNVAVLPDVGAKIRNRSDEAARSDRSAFLDR